MLALATVRTRWSSFVGSFVALTLGVAVLTAALLVHESTQPAPPPRLAGAAVVVRAAAAVSDQDLTRPVVPWPAGHAATLAGRLAELPGVAAAVPDRAFYAQVVVDGVVRDDPPAGDPLGHPWSTTALGPYRLVAGAAPRGPGEVALADAYGVAPGRPVTVLTAAGPTSWTVTATVDGPGIYVADRVADRLAGGVATIGLVLAPGADDDAVARAASGVVGGDGTVLVGDGLAALEPDSDARTRWVGAQVITVTAALAAFCAVFVMASTAGLGAHQRRREMALLRAVGATPGQVRRLMLGEAVVVGTLAAVVGAWLGSVFAPILGDLLVRAELEPPGFGTRFAPLPLAVAAATGIVVAVLGTLAASRRAARVRPQEALRRAAADEPSRSTARLVAGGLVVAAGLALAGLTPAVDPDPAVATALGSAMALMLGLALLAPVALPPLVRLILAPWVTRGAPLAILVRESAVTAVRRTAATAAPVLLTVGFTVLVFGLVGTASPVFGGAAVRATGADVVVAPQGSPGLSDATVAAVPGRVLSGLSTRVFAAAGSGASSGAPLALDAIGADRAGLARIGADLGADTLALSETAAARSGWRVGTVLRLVYADGTRASMRVAAVLPDTDLPAPVLLRRETVRAHDPSALTPVAYVTGADLSTVEAALAGGAAPGAARVMAATAHGDDEDRLVWMFALIVIVLAVGYTGIAVANTVVMASGDRRPDVAVLRLSGATGAQVVRAVVGETGLAVALGTVLGFLVALPALLGIRAALQELAGGPVGLVLPWPQIAAVVAACAGLALTAAVLATRPAVRGAPATVPW